MAASEAGAGAISQPRESPTFEKKTQASLKLDTRFKDKVHKGREVQALNNPGCFFELIIGRRSSGSSPPAASVPILCVLFRVLLPLDLQMADYRKVRLRTFAPLEERETPEGLCGGELFSLISRCTRRHSLLSAARFWRKFKYPVVHKLIAQPTCIQFCPTSPHDYAVTSGARVLLYDYKTHREKRVYSKFKVGGGAPHTTPYTGDVLHVYRGVVPIFLCRRMYIREPFVPMAAFLS
jgi:hypothetical protein